LIAALAALAAFFMPVAMGSLSAGGRMPAVWLTVALLEVPACVFADQPLAFATAILSVLFAMVAVGITRPYPSRRQLRRTEDRHAEALAQEMEAAGADLAEQIRNAPVPMYRPGAHRER